VEPLASVRWKASRGLGCSCGRSSVESALDTQHDRRQKYGDNQYVIIHEKRASGLGVMAIPSETIISLNSKLLCELRPEVECPWSP